MCIFFWLVVFAPWICVYSSMIKDIIEERCESNEAFKNFK